MEPIIVILTDVKSPYGFYTKFTIKGTGELIAEVDRRDGKYVLFGGPKNRFSEILRRSSKQSAIQLAKDYIRGFIPDAIFKMNVMTERIRFV